MRLALERWAQPLDPGNPRDDPERNARILHRRALLDVELDESVNLALPPGGIDDPARVSAHRLQRAGQRSAARVAQREVGRAQGARDGATSHAADSELIRLLAHEVDDTQLVGELASTLHDATRDLDGGQHAERSVEAPTARDRVSVRACDKGRPF